jgi:hypothetical protein
MAFLGAHFALWAGVFQALTRLTEGRPSRPFQTKERMRPALEASGWHPFCAV